MTQFPLPTRHLAASLTTALFLALPSAGYAVEVTAQQRAACEPDVFRLCSSSIPNIPKIITCMKQNKANLSPGCRAVIDAAEPQVATRSMGPESNWCSFGPTLTPNETNWHTWCAAPQ